MKLLLKQESELRAKTRHELVQRPQDELQSLSELQHRCSYLHSQLQHAFHISEQLTNAVSDQMLIMRCHNNQIKELRDELSYLKTYTLNQLDLFRDDLKSAYESVPEFKPT